MDLSTYFYNENQERIASLPGMVPLDKGTLLILKDGVYVVDEVQVFLNNQDPHNGQELGLRIYCKNQF